MTRISAPTCFVNEAGTAGIGHNTPPLGMDERRAQFEADLLVFCGDRRIEAALSLEELNRLEQDIGFLALRNAHLGNAIRMAHLDPHYDAAGVVLHIVFAMATAYNGVCEFSATSIAAAIKRHP